MTPVWNEKLQQWGYFYYEDAIQGEWWGIDRSQIMNNYEIETKMGQQIEKTFTYHAPKDDQPERYVAIRDKAKELAYLIVKNTPPSREQSLAITNLESAIYCANAAIARNE